MSLYYTKREKGKNSRKRHFGRGAIKKHRVARPDERIETFRSDITASNSLWSIILQSLLSPIPQEAGTFFRGCRTSIVRVAGQKDAFIKWCFSFCVFARESNSSFPFGTFAFVRPYFLSPRPSSGRYFEHSFRGCDRGAFACVFHELIFLLQELIFFFYFLIAQASKNVANATVACKNIHFKTNCRRKKEKSLNITYIKYSLLYFLLDGTRNFSRDTEIKKS